MRDGNGRKIDYIRISVTDRCNLRCRYCMPEEGIDLMRHEDILTYQEILKIAETGARLGIRRVKVTGGEPLVRKGVSQLIRELNAIEGMEDVTLTTNGLLLGTWLRSLRRQGSPASMSAWIRWIRNASARLPGGTGSRMS